MSNKNIQNKKTKLRKPSSFFFLLSSKDKGSALAYALVMLTIVMIILVSMLNYIVSQLKFSFNRVEKEEAFQAAEAGIYYYRWYLSHITLQHPHDIDDFWQSGQALGTGGNAYEVDYEGIGKYRIETTTPEPGSTIVTVKSTGWTYKEPNMKRVVQARFRRPSWSEYIFLSESFMNFGDQATVYGKVHSNTGIRFDGKAYNTVSALPPSFNDPTWGGNRKQFGVHTTVNPADPDAPSYPWPSSAVPNRPDIFKGGRAFPTSPVSFTGVSTDISTMRTQSQSGHGKYFDGTGIGRRINLKSDGTYDVCTVNSAAGSFFNGQTKFIDDYSGVITGASGSFSSTNGTSCTTSSCCLESSCPYIKSSNHSRGKCVSLANYNIINDGVIFVEDSIWLEGTVNNKRITVVAANSTNNADIYIGISDSNLRYTAYDCNNMLGLVAQRDVRVLASCPTNFIVDAALLAQSGVVGINDNGSFSAKGSLTFNGAIASYLQPYFQNGNSGFADRTYNFNNNLLYCPPPYFPTGTDYSIDLWEEL